MATTTTNFGWDIPQSTDLVKDGATAIATLGQDIDTAMVDLKGGTTGQVLSKNSDTDLDFIWVAQDDSNAIQNAIVDAKGDLIAATAADTPARLAVGTNGQVLTADSTASTGLKWSTPSAKVVQIVNTQSQTTSTGTGTIPSDGSIPQITEGDQYMTLAITPTSASNILLIDVVAISAAGSDTIQTTALFQDSTANALAACSGLIAGTDKIFNMAFKYKMTAGTTSSTTFRVRIGGNAGTTTFNGRAGGSPTGATQTSSITITEFTP